MIRKLFLVLLIVIAFSAITNAQNSYIQVVAEPGIAVFLNGDLFGFCENRRFLNYFELPFAEPKQF